MGLSQESSLHGSSAALAPRVLLKLPFAQSLSFCLGWVLQHPLSPEVALRALFLHEQIEIA